MATVTVKWFNPTKGYGFIQPTGGGGGKDVFVHISAVEQAGLNSLNEGQAVEYEIESNRGKDSAVKLKIDQVTVLSTGQADVAAFDCQLCGACCSFSAEWPRFSLEDEAYINQIPRAYVDDQQGRMRCSGNRCAALVGDVGVSTACAIYTVRPDVCKACLPGDDACQSARRGFNLLG
jgi:cold shock CspA family protein